MSYYKRIYNAIKNSDLNENTTTLLENQIIDISNRIDDLLSEGLPDDDAVKEEHQIGNKILDRLQLYYDGQHMDNVTIPETNLILNSTTTLIPNCSYFGANFKNDDNETFFDLFYDYYDYIVKYSKKMRAKMHLTKAEIVTEAIKLVSGIHSKAELKQIFKNNSYAYHYYSHYNKYIRKVNAIFTDYLKQLHLINKDGKPNMDLINGLNDKALIHNYCKYHCVSFRPVSDFTRVLNQMFKSFSDYSNAVKKGITDSNKVTGIYFALRTLDNNNFKIIGNFKLKNNLYGINYSRLTILIIMLNLFADYVQQRAFKANDIAGRAINQITTCKSYDNKLSKYFDKLNKESDAKQAKTKKHSKEDKDSNKKGDDKDV